MSTYIARQPIFDAKQHVVAYELLYRGSATSREAQVTDGNLATAQIMSDSLTLFGLDTLTGGRQAFINFTRDMLVNRSALAFNKEQLIIEVLEDVPADAAVVESCAHYTQEGYILALDDVVSEEQRHSLVELARIIKVDFMLTTPEERDTIARRYHDKTLLAEKVETHQEFILAQKAGYDLFQGFFFAVPETLHRTQLKAGKVAQIKLLSELRNPTLDPTALAAVISNDLSLSYKLLRYINSAYFALRTEIKSIKHALVMLGEREIRNWASLIIASELTDDKPRELLRTGLNRAYFLQRLATERGDRQLEETLFMLGLFSILDAATDRPFDALLTEITLDQQVSDALLQRPGKYLNYLNTARIFEGYNDKITEDFIATLPFSTDMLFDIYLRALEWSHKATCHITSPN